MSEQDCHSSASTDLSKPKPKYKIAAPADLPDPWKLLDGLNEAPALPEPVSSATAAPQMPDLFPSRIRASETDCAELTPASKPNFASEVQCIFQGVETGTELGDKGSDRMFEQDAQSISGGDVPSNIRDDDLEDLLKVAADQASECGSSSSFLCVSSKSTCQSSPVDQAIALGNQDNIIAAAHLSLRSPQPKLLREEGFWGSFFNPGKDLEYMMPPVHDVRAVQAPVCVPAEAAEEPHQKKPRLTPDKNFHAVVKNRAVVSWTE